MGKKITQVTIKREATLEELRDMGINVTIRDRGEGIGTITGSELRSIAGSGTFIQGEKHEGPTGGGHNYEKRIGWLNKDVIKPSQEADFDHPFFRQDGSGSKK